MDKKVQVDQLDKNEIEKQELAQNLSEVRNSVVVLSGKGGVGKSTVAVNLAYELSVMGYKTGLIDIDIHGPSVPILLGLEGRRLESDGDRILPIEYNDNLKVISIGFLLEDSKSPVIWKGPLKYGVIKQFLKDVVWGQLDYLIIDSPPGTGDEPLGVCQLIPDPTGAVIVTTPQDVALSDVRKSITFCEKINMPVIGVVENMSGFSCPHCGEEINLFKKGGGEKMSIEMGVAFLGSIPLDPGIASRADEGKPAVVTEKDQIRVVVDKIKDLLND